MSEPTANSTPLSLGVLISGGGTTLANLIEHIRDGRLHRVRIAQVISSRPDVRGVEIARAADLPLEIVERRSYPDVDAYSAALTTILENAAVDLVAMGGFLQMWRFPPAFRNRVLNIHPALLPDFGGRGMYGERVHRAVLDARVAESGCTVHIADHDYDHGPIVAQRRVPVLPDDNIDALAERVGAAERTLYPEVIQQIADHGVAWLEQFGASG